MLTGLLFMAVVFTAYIFAILRGPFWALVAYAIIYFNAPIPDINWWGSYTLDLRWSLLTISVLLVSIYLHRDQLSQHKFYGAKWITALIILTFLISQTVALNPAQAHKKTYMLFTFGISMFCIIKTLSNRKQLRLFLLLIIGLAGTLSFNAFLHGKRIHERLEGIGPADALGSNEFGILLAAIIPLTIPFLFRGKRYEKLFCISALVFILNGFVLCNSRGAFVSFLGAIIYVYFFVASKKIKKYLLVAAICLVPLMLYLADPAFLQRISSLYMFDLDFSRFYQSGKYWQVGNIQVWFRDGNRLPPRRRSRRF